METWVLFLLCCYICFMPVIGTISGLAVVEREDDGLPPALTFQSSAGETASTILLASDTGLEVRHGGSLRATLSKEVSSLPFTQVRGDLDVSSLSLAGMKQWALWHFDSFDSENSEWSSSARGSCNVAGDSFLGGHCQFAATNTTRQFFSLPDHSKVKVRARLHFIDNWEGDSLLMQVDGHTAWSQSHSWCPGLFKWKCTKLGLNSCGGDTPDRLSVKAEAILEHSGPQLQVGFASTLAPDSDACEASWGVDDVSIELL
eukprot:TRINITY_DN84412_c0_g1_i1.p1 TRINITY_DN84412_c0_g1~~TRINITY_DN84412_c0_g1_i1.p1  ORF type:complete len:259 (+),score=34.35 TRINITY_DN84412_c0_g1_i1:185-961(+)